jgi:type IX secretion system PorP/SprF family membrane protein
MRKNTFIQTAMLIAGLGALPLVAQQDPMYTHFTFNKVLYNPAYAGASGQFCLNAITHQQWLGYDDESPYIKTQSGLPVSDNIARNIAPKTTGAGFTAPLRMKLKGNTIDIGGVYAGFISDQIAYENNTYMKFGLAGAYNLSSGANVRLGVDFTSLTKELDGQGLRYHDPGDPLIPTGTSADTRVTMGLGAYYSDPNIMGGAWGSLSMTHLMPQTFAYGPSGAIQITTARHLYLAGGVRMDNFMGNPSLTLDPAFKIRTVMGKGGLVKPELDLQGIANWNDLFAGGLNLRSYGTGLDALSVILGYYPPLLGNAAGQQKLRVGYSYDITMSNLVRNSFGTHEVQVNYCFMISLPERPEIIYRHPRWMEHSPEID